MADRKRKRAKRNPSRHRSSMKLITIILLLVCGTMGYRTWQMNQQAQQYAEEEQALEAQIAEAEEEQEAIVEQIEYINSDDYIEDMAREKLGLVYENEIIFKKQER